MSAGVLAAWDRALPFLEGLDGVHSDAVAARTAVAELIDAAYAVEKLATLHDGDDRMFDRLRAAIARVQGGEK